MKIVNDLDERISLLRDYYYLFSNATIRPIHIEKEKCVEVYQIKEYRIPTKNLIGYNLSIDYLEFNDYEIWRYRNNPLANYTLHCCHYRNNDKAVFSIYENRLQIIDYFHDLEGALRVAHCITTKMNHIDEISFWSEVEQEGEYILLPTWKHYKILNPLNIDIDDIMANDKCRMGMSDVF